MLAKENKLKFSGAFQCLTSQVDLTSSECEASLALWESHLQRLRNESSVRVIASEISMSQSNPAVRIMARKNGNMNAEEGVLVIGNMLNQVKEFAILG